jgi:hypothetical protein
LPPNGGAVSIVAMTVKKSGSPAASLAVVTKGFVLGVVIVTAA